VGRAALTWVRQACSVRKSSARLGGGGGVRQAVPTMTTRRLSVTNRARIVIIDPRGEPSSWWKHDAGRPSMQTKPTARALSVMLADGEGPLARRGCKHS
jgi:hypothetical protein